MTTRTRTNEIAPRFFTKSVGNGYSGVCLSDKDPENCLFSTPSTLITAPQNAPTKMTSAILLDTETRTLEKAIALYKSKYIKNSKSVQYNSTWKRYPKHVESPLLGMVMDYMKYELKRIFGENFKLGGPPDVISEKRLTDKKSVLEFNVYIANKINFTSRRILVQLLVIGSRIETVNDIRLDTSNNADSTRWTPKDSTKEYLTTENTLFLQTPFKTNYKGLVSPQEKIQFEAALNRKRTLLPGTSSEFKCFGNRSMNKTECTLSGGVWDSPVSRNNECPFYLSNENYPNEFGGQSGYSCQFPLGTTSLGYRNISADPGSSELCYNCNSNLIGKGTLGRCCESQKDRQLYPKLQTPDYAFPGDQPTRKLYKDILDYKNMSIM